MTQYTDALIEFKVEGRDLTQMPRVLVTLSDPAKKQKITIENPPMTYTEGNTEFSIELTQAQSAVLPLGELWAMVNYFTPDGKRHPTTKAKLVNMDNLLDEVIEYE